MFKIGLNTWVNVFNVYRALGKGAKKPLYNVFLLQNYQKKNGII